LDIKGLGEESIAKVTTIGNGVIGEVGEDFGSGAAGKNATGGDAFGVIAAASVEGLAAKLGGAGNVVRGIAAANGGAGVVTVATTAGTGAS
jgi:hypothetical protein